MAESKMCHNVALENKKINKGLQPAKNKLLLWEYRYQGVDTFAWKQADWKWELPAGCNRKNNPLVDNMATIHFSKLIYNPLITHKIFVVSPHLSMFLLTDV